MGPTQKKPPGSLYGPLARRADHQGSRAHRRAQPARVVLTPGQAGDCPAAAQLLGHLRENTIVLADKAYDADWLRRQIEAAGAAPNIPPMVHRRRKPCFSPVLYRARNRIERFFNRIKHFRRLATRYEKHAANFLAMLKPAATHLWLRHNESVT
jgi:transposase